MARMIGEAGGAENLREMALAQVAEIDKWFAEVESSRGQGVAEDQIELLREQAKAGRDANEQIATAALCYAGR